MSARYLNQNKTQNSIMRPQNQEFSMKKNSPFVTSEETLSDFEDSVPMISQWYDVRINAIIAPLRCATRGDDQQNRSRKLEREAFEVTRGERHIILCRLFPHYLHGDRSNHKFIFIWPKELSVYARCSDVDEYNVSLYLQSVGE